MAEDMTNFFVNTMPGFAHEKVLERSLTYSVLIN